MHDVKSSREKATGAKPLFYDTAFESALRIKFPANVTAVQLATPDGVNVYVKEISTLTCSKIVIPAWSYDELESLQGITKTTVKIGGKEEPFFLFGYELFGGILRTRMLHLKYDESVSNFREDIEASNRIDGYFKFEEFSTTSELAPKVPSSVALIVPNETFNHFAPFLDFVSDAVMIFCHSTVQGEVERYWRKRMNSVESKSAQGAILEALVKSKLLLWHKAISTARTAIDSPCGSPLKYRFLEEEGTSKPHDIKLCLGPFVSIVMRVSTSGAEFANMPALCDAALGKQGGSVLVTFSNSNTPAIDFALLTRASESCPWQVYFLQCTVASSHPFPTAAANVLEGLFADHPKQAVLQAFIWVGRANGAGVHGVSSLQADKGDSKKFPFKAKQAIESIDV